MGFPDGGEWSGNHVGGAIVLKKGNQGIFEVVEVALTLVYVHFINEFKI